MVDKNRHLPRLYSKCDCSDYQKNPVTSVSLLATGVNSIFISYPMQVHTMAKGNFWLAALAGFIIMVLLGGVLPILGPIIGGVVAGLIAKGGMWNGAKAGCVAGIFGALVTSIIALVIGTMALGLLGFLAALGVGLILVILALYFAILGLVGGAIGGIVGN
jgi:hypothetical protein